MDSASIKDGKLVFNQAAYEQHVNKTTQYLTDEINELRRDMYFDEDNYFPGTNELKEAAKHFLDGDRNTSSHLRYQRFLEVHLEGLPPDLALKARELNPSPEQLIDLSSSIEFAIEDFIRDKKYKLLSSEEQNKAIEVYIGTDEYRNKVNAIVDDAVSKWRQDPVKSPVSPIDATYAASIAVRTGNSIKLGGQIGGCATCPKQIQFLAQDVHLDEHVWGRSFGRTGAEILTQKPEHIIKQLSELGAGFQSKSLETRTTAAKKAKELIDQIEKTGVARAGKSTSLWDIDQRNRFLSGIPSAKFKALPNRERDDPNSQALETTINGVTAKVVVCVRTPCGENQKLKVGDVITLIPQCGEGIYVLASATGKNGIEKVKNQISQALHGTNPAKVLRPKLCQ